MTALIGPIGLAAWVCIVLFFIDVEWRGRILIAVWVGVSLAIAYFIRTDDTPALPATIGFVMRTLLAVVFLIRLKGRTRGTFGRRAK